MDAVVDVGIESLLREAQDGDERAFAHLYERYFDRVYGYMRIALEDEREAEDASRHVFLKMIGMISGYERSEMPFSDWLLLLARNEAIDRVSDGDGLEPAVVTEVRLWSSDSELTAMVQELPAPERRALLLRHVLDLDDREVAQAMSVSPRKVRRLQRVAMGRLRRLGKLSSGATRARTRKHATAPSV